jgi:hypothetical protein
MTDSRFRMDANPSITRVCKSEICDLESLIRSLHKLWLDLGRVALTGHANYFEAGKPQVSSKNPAVTMPPGARDDIGTSTSTTAKSGSLGTCRALFR